MVFPWYTDMRRLIRRKAHADNNSILYDLQHGFRKKLSRETQLIEFTDDITKKLIMSGKQTDCIIIDFAKAWSAIVYSHTSFNTME